MAFDSQKFLKSIVVNNESDQTIQIEVVPAGTAGKTTIISSQTANKTITLPDATDTLVGKATVDIFTNKTFNVEGTGNSIINISDSNIKSGAGINVAKLANGLITNTEFQYLSGTTSNIQNQINSKVSNTGGTITGSINMSGQVITNLGAPVASTDAATKQYVDNNSGSSANRNLSNLLPTQINQELRANAGILAVFKSADNPGATSESATITTGVGINSGYTYVKTGDATTFNSGQIQIISGLVTSTTSTASTGKIIIKSGDNGSYQSAATTGNIELETGVISGFGTGGSIKLTTKSGTGSSGSIDFKTDNSTSYNSGNITVTTGTAGTTRGAFIIDTAYVKINSQKDVRFYDADNSHYSGFKAHATTTQSLTYTLPPADGTANQYLKTNGTAALSWSTIAGLSFGKETKTLIAGDITNQYIDLSQVISPNSLDFMLNGMIYNEGVDYTVSFPGGGITRVAFAGDLASSGQSALAIGDVVYVKYNY